MKVGEREELVKVKVRVLFRARQDKKRKSKARQDDKPRQHKTTQDKTTQ